MVLNENIKCKLNFSLCDFLTDFYKFLDQFGCEEMWNLRSELFPSLSFFSFPYPSFSSLLISLFWGHLLPKASAYHSFHSLYTWLVFFFFVCKITWTHSYSRWFGSPIWWHKIPSLVRHKSTKFPLNYLSYAHV